MDDNLKKQLEIKYKEAKELETENQKDEEKLKNIHIESEKIIKEYKYKYGSILNKKDQEIQNLQKQIEQLESKTTKQKQILSKLPNYIKKIYKI